LATPSAGTPRPGVRVGSTSEFSFDRTLYTVRQLRKPIFTAVNGIAYGGGCELAQSTDFIIASNNATFGQPEVMLGLAAGGGSPALLPRLLPQARPCRC
jgi:enoyl-CoA hydratase